MKVVRVVLKVSELVKAPHPPGDGVQAGALVPRWHDFEGNVVLDPGAAMPAFPSLEVLADGHVPRAASAGAAEALRLFKERVLHPLSASRGSVTLSWMYGGGVCLSVENQAQQEVAEVLCDEESSWVAFKDMAVSVLDMARGFCDARGVCVRGVDLWGTIYMDMWKD